MHLTVREQDDRKPRNSNYEKDIVYVTKQTIWILKSIGIWPVMLNGIARFLPKIAIVITNLILIFTVIPLALYILFDLKDTIMKLKLFGLLSFCLISLIKYWALVIRNSRIREFIEEVKSDWKQVEPSKDREMMLKYGRIGRKLTMLCTIFMYSGGAIYHTILPFASRMRVDEYNHTIKPLVYPTYSALFDVQRSPIYEMVYLVHCMCGYVIYSITASACGLAALFATHLSGQIDIIMSRLSDLADGKELFDLDRRLVKIVEHHLRILRFSAVMQVVFQEICFVEFVGSTCIICLLEYYCITDWKLNDTVGLTTYTMLLISCTFNVFILCYIGELLLEKSSKVGLSCFMISWYRLPTKTIHGLILIIAMSNNPVKISAGKVIDLSLSTFGSILKTSLAYLSFLRTAVM